MSEPEMTIDERLRFLLASSRDSLAQSQELHQTVARQADEQARQAAEQIKHQRALVAAIRAYLEGMNGTEHDGTP
jgi:hypothetical protein